MPLQHLRRSLILLACPALLAACGPKPEPPLPPPSAMPTASTTADVTVFMGHWRQSAMQVAPWWREATPPTPNPEFATTDTVLTPLSSSGPGIVTCERAIYEAVRLPPESLFEGNLPDPANQSRALGFTEPQILTLNQGCQSSTGDLELIFHRVDDDTILLGLDNMIYTLKRVTAPTETSAPTGTPQPGH
jgi:hypothetical protein